jgi:hypothetical protein
MEQHTSTDAECTTRLHDIEKAAWRQSMIDLVNTFTWILLGSSNSMYECEVHCMMFGPCNSFLVYINEIYFFPRLYRLTTYDKRQIETLETRQCVFIKVEGKLVRS